MWITDSFPSCDDGDVLIRTSGPKALAIGRYGVNNRWRWIDGIPIDDQILGWMHLEDAAAVLDNLTPIKM
jgi:hypothetical protein